MDVFQVSRSGHLIRTFGTYPSIFGNRFVSLQDQSDNDLQRVELRARCRSKQPGWNFKCNLARFLLFPSNFQFPIYLATRCLPDILACLGGKGSTYTRELEDQGRVITPIVGVKQTQSNPPIFLSAHGCRGFYCYNPSETHWFLAICRDSATPGYPFLRPFTRGPM